MSITLTVNGQIYRHWSAARVSRDLLRAAAFFEFTTVGEYVPEILPFNACTIQIDDQLVLSGYVEQFEPHVTPTSSTTVVRGRSKVCDLVDCMVPLSVTNEFDSSSLAAIATALAKPFGVNIVVANPAASTPFANSEQVVFERSETVFSFLDRLAKLQGVLLYDDPNGDLVLGTVGTARAAGDLVMGQGGNIVQARGKLDGTERFQQYVVLSQVGKQMTQSAPFNVALGSAFDFGVPRFRVWVGIAEGQVMDATAQTRAQWEAARHAGQSVNATVVVPEFGVKGTLWQANTLARVDIPRFGLNADYLIGAVTYLDDAEGGRRTEILVAPPNAYAPGLLNQKWTGQWSGIKAAPPAALAPGAL
jgi:prophage tail gpP-like protein